MVRRQRLHRRLREAHVLRVFVGMSSGNGGFRLARRWLDDGRMAAVFALVFLPALAAIGFMARADGVLDVRTVMALAVFIPMAFGVFYCSLRMAKRWEEQAD